MLALLSIGWAAFELIGPPLGLNDRERKLYFFYGLCAFVLCAGQAFFVLIKENRELKDRPFRFVASISETFQFSGDGLPIAIHRIGIKNESMNIAEHCELIISSMPIVVEGLTKDTPLQVKDTEDRFTDINRGATKHFDLLFSYRDKKSNRLIRTLVMAPNMPAVPITTNKEFGNIILTLTGKNFDPFNWTLRVVLQKGAAELGSILPMQPL